MRLIDEDTQAYLVLRMSGRDTENGAIEVYSQVQRHLWPAFDETLRRVLRVGADVE